MFNVVCQSDRVQKVLQHSKVALGLLLCNASRCDTISSSFRRFLVCASINSLDLLPFGNTITVWYFLGGVTDLQGAFWVASPPEHANFHANQRVTAEGNLKPSDSQGVRLQIMKRAKPWALLEAKTAPWHHRPANRQCAPSSTQAVRQALKEKREKLVRETFMAKRDASHPNISDGAKLMNPVPSLQIPEKFGTKSLEQIRGELQHQILPEAIPCIVTIEGKAPSNVYVVCPNSYDTDHGTVQVFRAADPADQKETIQWSKCSVRTSQWLSQCLFVGGWPLGARIGRQDKHGWRALRKCGTRCWEPQRGGEWLWKYVTACEILSGRRAAGAEMYWWD